MAYNEKLADRVREALADMDDVEEKKMFQGLTFMVNGKMCVSVRDDEIMCRIAPELMDVALEKNGTRQMTHGGRTMKGFIFVSEESIKSKNDFDYWINLSKDFNKKAKASKKTKQGKPKQK